MKNKIEIGLTNKNLILLHVYLFICIFIYLSRCTDRMRYLFLNKIYIWKGKPLNN